MQQKTARRAILGNATSRNRSRTTGWTIAALRFVLNGDTDLQSEISPIAQKVRQILTAWLPDFVALNFTLELSEDMQIVAKPIAGVDKREGRSYLASVHFQIRMKRGELPEELTQIWNRFKIQ